MREASAGELVPGARWIVFVGKTIHFSRKIVLRRVGYDGFLSKAGSLATDEGREFPIGMPSIHFWNLFPHCEENGVHLWLGCG